MFGLLVVVVGPELVGALMALVAAAAGGIVTLVGLDVAAAAAGPKCG